MATLHGLGSGSGAIAGVVNNVALSNADICTTNMSSPVDNQISGSNLSAPSKPKPESLSPGSRRKLSLTPELDRKTTSTMIGRRELDISEKFLRSFSESSSDDDGNLDDDLFHAEEIQRYKLEMAPIERQPLHSKLSVIKEEDSPSNTLQRTKSKEGAKLKLVIQPTGIDSTSFRMDDGTPVTPGKYNSNWDEFASTTTDTRNVTVKDKPSSWSSDVFSPDTGKRKGSTSSSSSDDLGHYPARSIISPQPVFRKMDRRSAVKKRSTNRSSNYDLSNRAQSPSSSSYFTYPSPDSVALDMSIDTSPSALVSGAFNVQGLGVSSSSHNVPREANLGSSSTDYELEQRSNVEGSVAW